ncbi:PREDICTED: 22.0 kDa heat shock protein-like [Ipomoea nil]|uniref:22.0 kDa heat shock protein-like n=1 Tax=Ipomoea nil TaxID=35883 RepID=UPI00090101B6|nr:PREDICTED: 22.0 kDa heat shock protein-like [Ipomoea nil]
MANAAAYKELTPPFCWTEDSSSHCLILDLPGFRREEIKVEVDNEGHINISGEKKMNESKYIFFQQSFKPPENSRPETARVWLEEGILYVSISKQAKQKEGKKIPPGNPVQEQDQQNQSNTSSDEIDSEHENDRNRYDSCCSSDQNESTSEEDEEEEEFHDAKAVHNLKKGTILPMVADKLRRNNMIVIVLILAISLGVLVIHNKPTAMNYD